MNSYFYVTTSTSIFTMHRNVMKVIMAEIKKTDFDTMTHGGNELLQALYAIFDDVLFRSVDSHRRLCFYDGRLSESSNIILLILFADG